ncbi:hypothetical protein IFM89_002320 [Coptis chinensis]|uniref:Uncharacterized protein n=1 Tax=Coptis chinensis TaxID=261450 RepID=A0A835M4A9_9MAGN|nr:hypothetical protein IFM89_002320 [Coptis chinensis]
MSITAHFSIPTHPNAKIRTFSLPPLHRPNRRNGVLLFRVKVSSNESYLGMWRKAIDREKKEIEFQKIAENTKNEVEEDDDDNNNNEDLEKKSEEFTKLLEFPKEERDHVQRMQVIDRAAAAIAAARALLRETTKVVDTDISRTPLESDGTAGVQEKGNEEVDVLVPQSGTPELHTLDEKQELGMQFSINAEEATEALNSTDGVLHGVRPDGSKFWKQTGVEVRPNGVVCRWTLTRGVSADKSVEWEDKFWEAADQYQYKELGSEKSGRNATGNVWREYWKESMGQDLGSGLLYMEKTADKWGKNGMGDEWHEKWWEHYDASGQAEKWAHKWCSIDPYTPLEAGHAHVWHERWGEKYDGHGSSIKYTDKWAERLEGDGWTKWGDKWDENFNQYSQGVKQGETWWEGKYGERWNRTWGEGHNGSGWVHKYGKSSCGEHWDTHVQQDTWYERYPHFGFHHCFENSVQLREVHKSPPETSGTQASLFS